MAERKVRINETTYEKVSKIQVPTGDVDTSGNPINEVVTYVETSDSNASAADIYPGKVVYVNGEKVTGGMTVSDTFHKVLDTSETVCNIQKGFHEGGSTVSIQTEIKEVTPKSEEQKVTASTGKVIREVTVAPVPAEGLALTGDNKITANGTYKQNVRVDVSTGITTFFNEVDIEVKVPMPEISVTGGVMSIK